MIYTQNQFNLILETKNTKKLLINSDLINYIEWYNFYYENSTSNISNIQ